MIVKPAVGHTCYYGERCQIKCPSCDKLLEKGIVDGLGIIPDPMPKWKLIRDEPGGGEEDSNFKGSAKGGFFTPKEGVQPTSSHYFIQFYRKMRARECVQEIAGQCIKHAYKTRYDLLAESQRYFTIIKRPPKLKKKKPGVTKKLN